MALQGSGAISISEIRNEQVNNGGFGSTYSLRTLSSNAGFGTPDAMSEFYSYTAATNVIFNFYYPNYVGCYNTYYFGATSNAALNTTVTVTMYWYGDLGGAFQGTVTISASGTCGYNYNVSSGGVNCNGEYLSSINYYFTPGSSGNQNYVGGAYYTDLYPCG